MNSLITSFPLTISVINNEKLNVFQSTSIRLFLNIKGETKILINNIPYNLAENDIIILNSYDMSTIFKSNSLLIALEIDTTQLSLSESDKKAYFVCNSTITKDKEKFLPLKSIIVRLISSHTEISQPKAFSTAYEIYDVLLKNFTKLQHNAKTVNNKINEIIKYVESNYSENLLLNDIADKFNFSAPYLSKLFKDSTGKSFGDFYDELRINHSLYDLLETNETIIDIAYKHGFPNNHAYIRAYKKIKGILPNVARKRHTPSEEDFTVTKDREGLIEQLKKLLLDNNYEELNLYVNADYNQKSKGYLPENPSHEVLGIGHATTVLSNTTKHLLTRLQNQQPFHYAFVRGIFSDELSFCSRNNNGLLSYQFALIDEILDFLISVNLTPMLSFAYMPSIIAKKTKFIPYDGYNIVAPRKIEEWTQSIAVFLNHVITRYGKNNVENWIIIPWNVPFPEAKQNSFLNDEDFYAFYKATYDTIKNLIPQITVFSFEMHLENGYAWLNNFLKWSKNNNCLPESIALTFPNLLWQAEKINTNSQMAFNNLINEDIPAEENLMRKNIEALNNFLISNDYHINIYVTSFDCSLSKKHMLFETLYAANYYLKNYVDNFLLIKSLACWRLTDHATDVNNEEIFEGGSGIFLHNGISKSMAHAIQFLNHARRFIIGSGDFYLMSKHKEISNYYHLLLFNYEQPTAQPDRDFDSYNINPYSLFRNTKKKVIHLKLDNVPYSHALIRAYIVNKNYGATYEKWVSMGMPDLNKYSEKGKAVFRIFDSKTFPDFKQKVVPIKNSTLRYDFKLDLFEIYGIEILFSNSPDVDSFVPN